MLGSDQSFLTCRTTDRERNQTSVIQRMRVDVSETSRSVVWCVLTEVNSLFKGQVCTAFTPSQSSHCALRADHINLSLFRTRPQGGFFSSLSRLARSRRRGVNWWKRRLRRSQMLKFAAILKLSSFCNLFRSVVLHVKKFWSKPTHLLAFFCYHPQLPGKCAFGMFLLCKSLILLPCNGFEQDLPLQTGSKTKLR
jgi:hypothetical protein